jgi:predicted transcriptional regulator
MNKAKVLDTIKEMPADFDIEDLIERLIFIDKVEKGMKQAREGKVTSHQNVKRHVKEWSK